MLGLLVEAGMLELLAAAAIWFWLLTGVTGWLLGLTFGTNSSW